ncbi:MAG: cache domain-containing protein [Bacteroidia bacterium]|nr:cache domain-containing protein [Bacteroidia bacterium]
MKKEVIIIPFFILSLLMFGSCKKKVPVPVNGKAVAADSVNLIMSKIVSHAEKLEYKQICNWLSHDSLALNFINTGYYNYNQTADVFKEAYSHMSAEKFMPKKTSTIALSPDVVLWLAYGNAWGADSAGRTFVQIIAETWLWQKLNGKWTVVHYHESTRHMPTTETKMRIEKSLARYANDLKNKNLASREMFPVLKDYLEHIADAKGVVFAFKPFLVNDDTTMKAQYMYRNNCMLVKTTLPKKFNYTRADWYKNSIIIRQYFWTEPYFDGGGCGTWVITCGVPVYNKNDQVVGVIAADLEVN